MLMKLAGRYGTVGHPAVGAAHCSMASVIVTGTVGVAVAAMAGPLAAM